MNDAVREILRELDDYGIKPQVSDTAKHIRIDWIVNNQQQHYITSATPSDWRTRLNARAAVRRMLRSVGAVKEDARSFRRAISIPSQPMQPRDELIINMRNELDALIDLVFELVESKSEQPVEPATRTLRRAMVLDQLDFKHAKMPSEIARSLGVSNTLVSSHLNNMKKIGLVEKVYGGWTRKP